MNTNTGSFLAIAGLIVSGLSYFGIVVNQTEIVTVISGLVALYGIIHQIVITRKVVSAARAAGVVTAKGIKV